MANVYMSIFNRLRLEIKHENVVIATEQAVQKKVQAEVAEPETPARVTAISASQR